MQKIRVTQTKSSIACSVKQKKCLLGLGLKRVGNTRELEDTPAVQGMINVVAHLISFEKIGE